MIREMELLFQASRTSPMLHEAAVTVEEGIAALRTERDELVIQNERLGNDIVAAEARCARLQQALASVVDHKHPMGRSVRDSYERVKQIAGEALAGQPTAAEGPDAPADSCEGKPRPCCDACVCTTIEFLESRAADSQEDNT